MKKFAPLPMVAAIVLAGCAATQIPESAEPSAITTPANRIPSGCAPLAHDLRPNPPDWSPEDEALTQWFLVAGAECSKDQGVRYPYHLVDGFRSSMSDAYTFSVDPDAVGADPGVMESLAHSAVCSLQSTIGAYQVTAHSAGFEPVAAFHDDC